jgi:hypothetical protein
MVQDEQHHYEIDITQGDLFIQLSSDDVNFISDQMKRWFTVFIDDSYKPIVIPPTPVLIPKTRPPQQPLQAPVASKPSIDAQVNVSEAPSQPPLYEMALLEQVKQLQEQVQILTQQTMQSQQQATPPAQQTSSTLSVEEENTHPVHVNAPISEPEPELSIFDDLENDFAAMETQTPSEPVHSPPPKEEQENTLDAFVGPAHDDFNSTFGAFESAPPEPAVDLPSFEQPVNNTSFPVDNVTLDWEEQTIVQPALFEDQGTLPPFQQPVENSTQTDMLQSTAVTTSLLPPESPSAEEDLDLLLDSLMSDLEEKALTQSQADFMAELEDTLRTNVRHEEEPISQKKDPFEAAVEAPQAELYPAEPPLILETPPPLPPPSHSPLFDPPITGSQAFALPALEQFSNQDEAEPPSNISLELAAEMRKIDIPVPTSPLEEIPSFASFTPPEEPVSQMEPASNTSPPDLFEQELGSLFTEEATPSSLTVATPLEQELSSLFTEANAIPSSDVVPTMEPAQPNPEYERPEISYDFGIPGPPPSDDPKIKQLSLEALQTNANNDYDSPFPDPDEIDVEDLPHTKVTDQYSSKSVKGGSNDYQSFNTTEVASDDLMQIESLHELCELAPNAASGPDFLILAAYFLSNMKQQQKYALKDLNAQLVRSGLTPVNHGILEGVIATGYVQLVPDLTGTANAAEYELTEAGEAYAQGMINLS